MPAPGISKVFTTSRIALHRLVRRDLQRGVEQVAVEDHVQVLVGGDPGQQPLGHRVAGEPAGVAVRDPGRELLEGHVGERPHQVLAVRRLVALGHVRHPEPLELDRVDHPLDHHVVAHHDRVPALLGGPAVHPLAPGGVAAEDHGDLVVVARQVVLGEQVDDQRRPRHVRDVGVVRRPRVALHQAVEVAAVAPRDVVVREPLLRDARSAGSAPPRPPAPAPAAGRSGSSRAGHREASRSVA